MPELVPLYELCELAGGSDHAARFLSFHCPPPYLSACSQAIWPGPGPVLVRNYDYSPIAFDHLVLHAGWGGRTVMGTADGLWGLVDGMNDSGLAVSLTFGGRRVVGDGFVPLILRYVLQTCTNTEEAGRALARLPTPHELQRHPARPRAPLPHRDDGPPDRPTRITHAAVATNHQEGGMGAARRLHRHRRARALPAPAPHPSCRAAGAVHRRLPQAAALFLAFGAGFGTLYTAIYRPRRLSMEYRWPRAAWSLDLHAFREETRRIHTPGRGFASLSNPSS